MENMVSMIQCAQDGRSSKSAFYEEMSEPTMNPKTKEHVVFV